MTDSGNTTDHHYAVTCAGRTPKEIGKCNVSTRNRCFSILTSDEFFNNCARRELFGSWILQSHFMEYGID